MGVGIAQGYATLGQIGLHRNSARSATLQHVCALKPRMAKLKPKRLTARLDNITRRHRPAGAQRLMEPVVAFNVLLPAIRRLCESTEQLTDGRFCSPHQRPLGNAFGAICDGDG